MTLREKIAAAALYAAAAAVLLYAWLLPLH
jgi:hypothetical protein